MKLLPDGYVDELRELLESKDEFRDVLVNLAREIAKLSKVVIYKLIKGSVGEAEARAEEMLTLKSKLDEELTKAPEFLNSIAFAYQELSEAIALLTFLKKKRVPTHHELKVPPEPYLMGLADFCGELSRKSLERMLQGDISFAIMARDVIEDIYYSMVEVNPRSYELRKKVDYLANLITRLNDNIFKMKLASAGTELGDSGGEG